MSEKLRYCSFCGKDENNVDKLVAGPMVFICDECVTLSAEIVWSGFQDKINKIRVKQKKLEKDALSLSNGGKP